MLKRRCKKLRMKVGGGLQLYNIFRAGSIRIRSIALKCTNKLRLAHYLRKRDRSTLVLIHVMESDLACEAAPFPSHDVIVMLC